MKDLIIGFEFEGNKYGALIGFTIVKELGTVIADCRMLKKVATGEDIAHPELVRVMDAVGDSIIPMIQNHIEKEYSK